MYNNEDLQTVTSGMQSQTPQDIQWYTDPKIIITVLLAYLLVCAFITMAIAHENERGKFTAFLAGLFLGTLGVAAYAIMGESLELRVALEEKERRKLTGKHTDLKI